jgi:hypothetical protein
MSQIDDQVNDIVARSEAVAAELAAFANSALNIVIPDANTAIPGVFETILVGSDNDNNIGSQADSVLKVITDQTTSYDDNPIFVTYSGTNSGGGVLSVRKARGSQANAQPLEDGDIVSGMYAAGYDGTAYIRAAAMRFKVDGVVNAAAALETPMKVVIETKDETGITDERLVVKPDGSVDIGGEANNNPFLFEPATLDVKNSIRIWGETGGASIRIQDSNDQTSRITQLASTNALGFFRNEVEVMRLESGGNVGIGGAPQATSSYQTLNIISSTNNVGGAIRLSTSVGESGHLFNFDSYVYLGGDLGTIIGSGDPNNAGEFQTAYRIDRSSQLHRWYDPIDASPEIMRLSSVGGLTLGAAGDKTFAGSSARITATAGTTEWIAIARIRTGYSIIDISQTGNSGYNGARIEIAMDFGTISGNDHPGAQLLKFNRSNGFSEIQEVYAKHHSNDSADIYIKVATGANLVMQYKYLELLHQLILLSRLFLLSY